MNLALIYPLRHAGLALAIGLGACLNAGLLYRKLRQHGVFHPQPGWRKFGVRLAIALLAMGVLLALAKGSTELWLTSPGRERGLRLTALVLLGAGSYFGALWLCGLRPREFIKRTG
jgi:putative peptidoglycan lipid II flippase